MCLVCEVAGRIGEVRGSVRPGCRTVRMHYTYKGAFGTNSIGSRVGIRVYSRYRPFCAKGRGGVRTNKEVSGFGGEFGVS